MKRLLDFFFASNLDNRKRYFFIFIAVIICIQSLSSILPYQKRFDTDSETIVFSSVWGYANDLNFDYQPFLHPVLDYQVHPQLFFNSAEVPINNYNVVIQEKLRATGDKIPHTYYVSPYM